MRADGARRAVLVAALFVAGAMAVAGGGSAAADEIPWPADHHSSPARLDEIPWPLDHNPYD